MKKSNPARQKKRALAYRKRLAAYRKSETAKIVRERAAGRCERILPACYVGEWHFDDRLRIVYDSPRCGETAGLQDHHLTYARFGGDELPEDIVRCCKRCHEWFESLKPAGNRYTRNR